jgi:hypothetical protein
MAVIVLISARQASTAETIRALPDKVPCAVPDRQDFQIPDRVHLTGWVGARVGGNENELIKYDAEPLLAGYRKPPGREDWIGEMSGKWIQTATLVWVRTGDPTLRKKLDYFVAELCKCQREDGFLFTEKKQWASPWDVWVHKYNLIGLLTYIKHTGNRDPLPTCTRMADLLCKTFGDEPGKLNITGMGYCGGMAAVSVLEPMVLLYRFTGEQRYLDFCKYLQRVWVNPAVANLLASKRVAPGTKAYEYLACLNGALEYYRAVGGDRQVLDACLIAWQDIVDKKLYITGTSSWKEGFQDDFVLQNDGEVAETCVTVTWFQFNAQLLRLTGEARFAEQLERTVLNQLLGAQRPDCGGWSYFVPMAGNKNFGGLFSNCCLANGPRITSMIPTLAVTTDADGAVVNLYDAGTAQLALRDGTAVSLVTETLYPGEGRIRIAVNPAAKKSFAVKLRMPAWCRGATVQVNGEAVKTTPGYTAIEREWSPGDKIELNLPLGSRVVIGEHGNAGRAAMCYGPLVLAAVEAPGMPVGGAVISGADAAAALDPTKTALVFNVRSGTREIRMVPFADAGGHYKVWLHLPSGSLLRGGTASQSRNAGGASRINDDDPDTSVDTSDGKQAPAEDWFAVTLDKPVAVRRVVFVQGGRNDGLGGGYFVGKPKVQVQREKGGTWETVGEFGDYPVFSGNIPYGRTFTLRLAAPVEVVAVRVIGAPGSSDDPKRAYASCAELQAFGE